MNFSEAIEILTTKNCIGITYDSISWEKGKRETIIPIIKNINGINKVSELKLVELFENGNENQNFESKILKSLDIYKILNNNNWGIIVKNPEDEKEIILLRDIDTFIYPFEDINQENHEFILIT